MDNHQLPKAVLDFALGQGNDESGNDAAVVNEGATTTADHERSVARVWENLGPPELRQPEGSRTKTIQYNKNSERFEIKRGGLFHLSLPCAGAPGDVLFITLAHANIKFADKIIRNCGHKDHHNPQDAEMPFEVKGAPTVIKAESLVAAVAIGDIKDICIIMHCFSREDKNNGDPEEGRLWKLIVDGNLNGQNIRYEPHLQVFQYLRSPDRLKRKIKAEPGEGKKRKMAPPPPIGPVNPNIKIVGLDANRDIINVPSPAVYEDADDREAAVAELRRLKMAELEHELSVFGDNTEAMNKFAAAGWATLEARKMVRE